MKWGQFLLLWGLVVLGVLMLKGLRERWVGPQWRHNLFSDLLSAAVLGVCGIFVAYLAGWFGPPREPSNNTSAPTVVSEPQAVAPASVPPTNNSPSAPEPRRDDTTPLVAPRPLSRVSREPKWPTQSAATDEQVKLVPKEEELVLTLNCQIGPMPRRIPAEPEGLWGVMLGDYEYAGLARFFTLNPNGSDEVDFGQAKFAMAARCELLNFGDLVLRENILSVIASFRSVIKNGNNTQSGSEVSRRRFQFHIPGVLPSKSGKFVFYIWNGSELFASLAIERLAKTKTLNDELAKDAKVVMVGSIDLHLNPRELK